MPEKENKDVNVKEGEILIGEGKVVCFACGEVVDENTKICPYCGTELQ
jgi:rRNA maturation endonuclease Nob1